MVRWNALTNLTSTAVLACDALWFYGALATVDARLLLGRGEHIVHRRSAELFGAVAQICGLRFRIQLFQLVGLG